MCFALVSIVLHVSCIGFQLFSLVCICFYIHLPYVSVVISTERVTKGGKQHPYISCISAHHSARICTNPNGKQMRRPKGQHTGTHRRAIGEYGPGSRARPVPAFAHSSMLLLCRHPTTRDLSYDKASILWQDMNPMTRHASYD